MMQTGLSIALPVSKPRRTERMGKNARSAAMAHTRCKLPVGLAAIVCCAGVGLVFAQTSELTFDIKIEHGVVAPNMRLIRVKQGDAVKLRWSSDKPITLHLH